MTREEMLDRAVREALNGFRAAFWALPENRMLYSRSVLADLMPRIRTRFTQIAAIEGLRAREAAQ